MKSLLARLSTGDVLVSDGAMGTLLQNNGLQPGESPESWCLTHPDVVKHIAEMYVEAGADIIETNSFGGTRYKLQAYGLADQVKALNIAAASLAKSAMGAGGYVAASIGPSGQIVEDEGGSVTEDDLYQAFTEQVVALETGGADAICIETISSVSEAKAAIRAAKDHTGLVVMCTFTFESGARGFHSIMGVTPERAAEEAVAAGAHIVGANCGNGMVPMIEIARRMHAAVPDVPLLVQANAGAPVYQAGIPLFQESPEEMARQVSALLAAGASIIGGCCGTTPAHITAIARAVRQATGRMGI